MLEQIFLMALPILLMIVALTFDSTVFAFFAGISGIFVGLSLLDPIWAGMIYIGLGMYFMLTAVFAEWEE